MSTPIIPTTASIAYLCERAVAAGVMGIAVTDHYNCDVADRYHMDVRLRQSVFDVERARLAFGDSLYIAMGVELGQGHLYPGQSREVLAGAPFDFVLGTVHCDDSGRRIEEIDFDSPQVVVSRVMEGYFRVCLEMCRWGQFDSLAHLGYPQRIIWGRYRIPVDLAAYREMIEEVLRELIRQGKALELNTGGLRMGLGRIIPGPEVFRWYKDLGGELVTLGSDAHRAESLAYEFDTAMDLLTALGYEYFAFFKERRPVMLRLI